MSSSFFNEICYEFWNIVISPPGDYSFLNFVPIVIKFIYFQIGKSKICQEVSL